MKRLLTIVSLVLLLAPDTVAQQGNTVTINFPSIPTGSCSFVMRGLNASTGDEYNCLNGAWHKIGGGGGGGGLPSGAIVIINTGTCAALGLIEVAGMDGQLPVGTRNIHGNVGTTGGSNSITPAGTVSQPTLAMDSYTPTGTNGTAAFTPSGTVAWPTGASSVPTFSGATDTVPAETFTGSSTTVPAETFTGSSTTVPAETISWPAGVPTFSGTGGTVPAETISWPAGVPTFSGSALATHQHELPFQDPSASGTTNFRGTAPATFGTGTSRAAVWGITTTTVTTAAAVALSQAVSAGTPAGTIAWPAGVPTNGTAAFTPAGTIAWPAGVPTNASTTLTPLGSNASTTLTPLGTNASTTFTPSGTIAWPTPVPAFTGLGGTVPAESFTGNSATLTGTVSQPTFTGSAFDPHPAFTRVIYCQAP